MTERRVAEADVGSIVEDAGLDATPFARRDRADLEFLACGRDLVPQLVALVVIEQVDLEARDRGPAGTADHDGDTVDVELLDPVVLDVVDRWADELLQGLRGHRALHLHRVHVGRTHLGVEPARCGDAKGVQARVGISELHPPAVLRNVQEHRVVHDRTVGAGDEHVLALLHRALREVAAGDHVDQAVGVGPAHLDRALDSDVPHRDTVGEHPVLGLRIVEVGRQVHVVVDVVGRAPRATCGVEERRLPVPRAEVQGGALLEHLLALVDHEVLLRSISRRTGRSGLQD
jgi:hypothetical protein